MVCEWCERNEVYHINSTVYWELPDGSRAIEIHQVPGMKCNFCQMEYQEEKIIDEIEDQLMLVDTSKIGNQISFPELMTQPRLLKKNYFKFD